MIRAVVFAICFLLFSSFFQKEGFRGSCAFAEDAAFAAQAPTVSHIMTGRVLRSQFWAFPARGIKFTIAVQDPEGAVVNVMVTPATTLWDPSAKAIMIDHIQAGQRVRLVYHRTEEGLNVARSIKISK